MRDRVILVIVAAGTADRHAEHARAKCRHHVVELVIPDRLHRFGGDLAGIGAGHQEAGGARRVVVAGLDQVARHLQPQELVIRHVGTERLDDEVSVVKGAAAVGIEFIAAALAEPHRIEPVAGPAFAEARAVQQPVDQRVIGSGRLIGEKRLQFFGRGRQAGEVERHSPCQRCLGSSRIRPDAGRLLLGEDKAVDIVRDPRGVLHIGGRGGRGGRSGSEPAIGPVLPTRLDVDRPFVDRGCGLIPGIGGAHVDPGLEVGNHRVRQFAGGGHLEAVVLDRGQQQAVIPLARHHRGTALAPLGHPLAGIDEQVCLQLAGAEGVGRVALIAVLRENRPDLRLEEGDPFGGGRSQSAAATDSQHRHDNGEGADASEGTDIHPHHAHHAGTGDREPCCLPEPHILFHRLSGSKIIGFRWRWAVPVSLLLHSRRVSQG